MSRIIKFRVWNGETMVSPDYITRDGVAHWKENSIPQSSKELMQFTGLKDKKGVEIYEGDIIRSGRDEKVTHSIFYMPEEGRFGIRVGLGFGSINQGWINEFGKTVIGNIHQNPELL